MRILMGLILVSLAGGAQVKFREHTIATDLKGGYQVVAADLNGDGKPDLIALASGMPELVWFENPGWRRHVIVGGMSRMINLAVAGEQIVLASGFSPEAKKSSGEVWLLTRKGGGWSADQIDRLPTSHRLRLADIDGSGKPVVVNAPLTGAETGGPDYRGHTPLVYYRPGEWKRRLIGEETEGVMHGIHVVDWDGDGRDEILTASFVGIHLYKLLPDGRWRRTEIAQGDPSAWPKSGASDVTVGRLGQQRFLATIEPWHGHQVVVYREKKGVWQRQVLDDSYVDGHTIQAADLDGDGRDEIIAGYRGQGHKIHIFSAAGDGWRKAQLDDGVAAASCAVADLNGDGRLDLACIGSATANLKWYESQ